MIFGFFISVFGFVLTGIISIYYGVQLYFENKKRKEGQKDILSEEDLKKKIQKFVITVCFFIAFIICFILSSRSAIREIQDSINASTAATIKESIADYQEDIEAQQEIDKNENVEEKKQQDYVGPSPITSEKQEDAAENNDEGEHLDITNVFDHPTLGLGENYEKALVIIQNGNSVEKAIELVPELTAKDIAALYKVKNNY